VVIIRDFKLWYDWAVVGRQIVKIASGDVMTRVPVRLSRVALLSNMGKCLVSRTLHYVSISLLFTSHLNAFSVFERPSLKIKFSIIKISSKIIVSLSFVQKI